MSTLLYIVGPSNTGKTTCLNNVLGQPLARFTWPISHEQYQGGIQLGLVRDEFSGTDALGKHVQISVPNWLCGPYKPMSVVGEGMRFCTQKFMKMLMDADWEIEILRLTATDEVLAERRAARTEKQLAWLKEHKKATVHRDHEQTPEWLAANRSTVDKLYDYCERLGNICTTLDTSEGFDHVTAWLEAHPMVRDIKYQGRVGYDPGTPRFIEWHTATMKGRELLKEAGVGRWQWEPAMAFMPQDKALPVREEGDTLIEFNMDAIRWFIYAEPKRETEYGRLKRQREEREAKKQQQVEVKNATQDSSG